MINLQSLDVKSLMPDIMASDEDCIHIAEVFVEQLREIQQKLYLLDPIGSLDDQPDDALTHLAWEFSMLCTGEGWEEAKVSQQKIDLIKSAILLHKRKGTRWAVERLFGLISLDAELSESYEYKGDPYHFKARVDIADRGVALDTYKKLGSMIEEYKNVRSKLENLTVRMSSLGDLVVASAITLKQKIVVMPSLLKEIRYSSDSKIAQHMSIKFKTIVNPEIITKISYSSATSAVSTINSKYRCIVGGINDL